MTISEPEQQLERERARKMFAGPCDFMLGVAQLEQLPDTDLPEIALAGRSNVGKSSLINALTGRKTLAKTSNTPGRTQQLNYFNLGNKLYMVDMPGYGYAKVSKSLVKNWTKLIKAYLKGRPNLRCCFVLIDARHGLKESDVELMQLMDEAAVPYRIVLTKSDKLKFQELEKNILTVKEKLKKHPAAFPDLLITSARDKIGLEDLQDTLSIVSQS